MLQTIQPTSKTSLKQQCLLVSNGNLKEARELYAFFADDMHDLPDTDPTPLTWQQNTKATVDGAVTWFRENQDTLVQGYNFIRSIIEKKGVIPMEQATPLPPINEE